MRGYVTPESVTHGSSEQRIRWFKHGYATGDVNQCNTFAQTTLWAKHMAFPTAWGQAPDGFVYVTSYADDPPGADKSGESSSPLHQIVLDLRNDEDDVSDPR